MQKHNNNILCFQIIFYLIQDTVKTVKTSVLEVEKKKCRTHRCAGVLKSVVWILISAKGEAALLTGSMTYWYIYASVPSFGVSLWDLIPNLSSTFLADKSER